MRLSAKNPSTEPNSDDGVLHDLMCGIGPRHIKILCENPFDGGFGICPTKVGHLTLDQVFMLFAERDVLRGSKKKRSIKMGGDAVPTPGEDGLIAGRDADGNKIQAKWDGTLSLAAKIRLAEEQKKKDEAKPAWERRAENREKRRQERKKRNGN